MVHKFCICMWIVRGVNEEKEEDEKEKSSSEDPYSIQKGP